MKKVFSLMLALVMVFALAACGSNNNGGTASNGSATSTPASTPAEDEGGDASTPAEDEGGDTCPAASPPTAPPPWRA